MKIRKIFNFFKPIRILDMYSGYDCSRSFFFFSYEHSSEVLKDTNYLLDYKLILYKVLFIFQSGRYDKRIFGHLFIMEKINDCVSALDGSKYEEITKFRLGKKIDLYSIYDK